MTAVDLRNVSAIEVMGMAAGMQADAAAAVELYRNWLQQHPHDPTAYAIEFNLGVCLKEAGDDLGAEAAYRRSAQLNPGCLEAQFNLGSQLERLNRPQEAILQWQDMLTTAGRFSLPRDGKIYTMTLNNLGRILENMKSYAVAEDMLRRSLAFNPDQPDVIHHLVYLRQKQCAWPVYAEIPGVSADRMLQASGPMSFLAGSDDPAVHLERMQRYAHEKIPTPPAALSNGKTYGHERLRIGYLSSDFCMHAVSMLTVELFELHDRSRFEVYGFCWSKDDGTDLRQRVVKAFDHYVPIGNLSDEAAARLIHSLEIDVLVDLHGLTLGARPAILGWRPAPVQATYLGFPGTTGIPGIDYVLADRFVLPEETAQHFSEKPLYLPHCFQVSDRQRHVGPKPTRAECGLPEDAFVYCSFNNNYKFTPEIFAVWLRILKRVPGSVLWLLADNQWSEENLRRSAEAEGIDRARIIFAGRIAPAHYHARYQVADLFLDNRPYGAGTTANDALWAGLPLLTCPGRTFASRMAGSLLHALNLPELIAKDLDDYEERAVALGQDPQRMTELRAKLAAARSSAPLFNVPQLVRDIEDAFVQVVVEKAPEGQVAVPTRPMVSPTPAELSPSGSSASGSVATMRANGHLSIATLIPAYKPKYIPQLLLALTSQTLKPDVVIISDDSPNGIFRTALFAPEHEALRSQLNIQVHEGPRSGTAFDNLKNLVALEKGEHDLVHVLLDDDVIYPFFYERHEIAHRSGDISCSISGRWMATEEGQPCGLELPIPPFIQRQTHRMLSLDASLTFLTTVAQGANWFGEFSNAVFRRDCFPLVATPKMAGISYAGLWDLGAFLQASMVRPICYLQDFLGYFRKGGEQQNSGKHQYIKAALLAYIALAIAARRQHILTPEQVRSTLAKLATLLPVMSPGEEEIARIVPVMPALMDGEWTAEEAFLGAWNDFLLKYRFS